MRPASVYVFVAVEVGLGGGPGMGKLRAIRDRDMAAWSLARSEEVGGEEEVVAGWGEGWG